MMEVVFGLIVLALIGAFVLYVKESNKEKAKLINALMARTPKEAMELTMADKLQIKQDSSPATPPDMVPLEDVNQDEFEELVKDQLK